MVIYNPLEGFRYLSSRFIIPLEGFKYLSMGFIIPLKGFRYLFRFFFLIHWRDSDIDPEGL